MDFIIEIGTESQKQLIHQELFVFESVSKSVPLPIKILKVIVAADFDLTVNKYMELNSYKSRRGHLAIAKNIPVDGGVVLVFSPILYTDDHDTHSRTQIYIHEFFHIVTKCIFPVIPSDSKIDHIHLEAIYTLYDEYYANRKSFEVIEDNFKSMSKKYKRNQALNLSGFIKSILGDCKNYLEIKNEIQAFHKHNDVDKFLNNSKIYFEAISKSFTCIYSYFDHNSKLQCLEPILQKSHFFNNYTKSLFSFLKSKYENNDFDLSDGLHLIENFLLNYGVKFKDVGGPQLYCFINDI